MWDFIGATFCVGCRFLLKNIDSMTDLPLSLSSPQVTDVMECLLKRAHRHVEKDRCRRSVLDFASMLLAALSLLWVTGWIQYGTYQWHGVYRCNMMVNQWRDDRAYAEVRSRNKRWLMGVCICFIIVLEYCQMWKFKQYCFVLYS